MRSLRSRECGLYKAADILLGEHLYEKSDAVQWISVERPDKRKVRIKGYQELQQMAELDQTQMTCTKQISSITFIQIGQLPLVMFVSMIL